MRDISENENVSRQRIHTQDLGNVRLEKIKHLRPTCAVDMNISEQHRCRLVKIRRARGEKFFRHNRGAGKRRDEVSS